MIITDFSQILMANVFADSTVSACAKNPCEQSRNMLMHFGINSVRANYIEHKDTYGQLIIACDSRSWRKDVFPQYKWKRSENRKNDTSGINWEFVNSVSDELYSVLDEYFPFPLIKVKGAEADDVNGALVKHISTTSGQENMFGESEPEKIIILSSDKDNYQLHKYKNVRQWSMRDKKYVKPDTKPHLALLEKIVKGDSGDGIMNIKSHDNFFVEGVGRQKSITQKYLDQFMTSVNPIEVCETEQERINFIRNETLVSYEKMPEYVYNGIIEQYEEKKNKTVSKAKLMEFFVSKRMNNLMANIHDFF